LCQLNSNHPRSSQKLRDFKLILDKLRGSHIGDPKPLGFSNKFACITIRKKSQKLGYDFTKT